MSDKFIKEMFGVTQWPKLDFDLSGVLQNAQKLTGKLSISGVQPKLSVKVDKKTNQLISVAEGGAYILKPQTAIFPNIPENEQCCMDIAQAFDIDVPLHCLLPLKDKSLAYVVKRFDRKENEKIHQEDFSQILQQDKYKGSVEQIGRKLGETSTAPGYDQQLFFERVLLNFILGNGDAHLKNYSISYRGDEIRLSPAYDIVCSKLVIPDEEESALNINGKKNRLFRADFDKLADFLNVPSRVRYEKFEKKFKIMKDIIKTSKIDQEKQTNFLSIIKERLHQAELDE